MVEHQQGIQAETFSIVLPDTSILLKNDRQLKESRALAVTMCAELL